MVKESKLEYISPDDIGKNPDNPRLIFRQDEMDNLLDSINETGIQVPLTVYRDGNQIILIDGERRWRCAKKLNLKVVPVIVQPKPTKLGNILMMFHIHNVRVQWDPLVIAFKLDEIKKSLEKEGKPAGQKELAALTGISIGGIRRYLDLLNLPSKYRELLLKELEKPKHAQKISADLIIEIQRSFKTINTYVPEAISGVDDEKYIDIMLKKYEDGVVNNVVKFRNISKIARAERAGQERTVAINAIRNLISHPKAKIEDTYTNSVKIAYDDREIIQKSNSLQEKIEKIDPKQITPSLKTALKELRSAIDRVMRD